MSKPFKPVSTVFEQVACELACTWYEVGRSQGLKSKWKDARSYGRANFEKFLPKALEYCVSMLGRQDVPDLMKAEIFEELHRRNNDPDINAMLGYGLPDLDVKKILNMLPKQERLPDINTGGSVLKQMKINPYKRMN